MHTTRPLGPAIKAQVTADYNGLPNQRITEQDDRAHVFTADLNELAAWHMALGGHIDRQPAPAGSGVVLYTLHTTTDPRDGIPVDVHTLALDTEDLDDDLARALT